MTGRHLLLCVVLVFALTTQVSAATTIPIIVQLSPNASIANVLPLIGGTLIDSIPGTNQYLVNISTASIPTLQGLLGLLGSIEWVDLNLGVNIGSFRQLGIIQTGVDPLKPIPAADWYKNQPALQKINSQQALQNPAIRGGGVVVADINSQVDYAHPALQGHMTGGYDFVMAKPAGETALNQSNSDFLDQSNSDFLDQSNSDFLDQSNSDFLDGL